MEILKHPHPGATRLRILGLSDPEKALQEIIHAQQQPELFQRILERFQKNISGILAGNTQNTVFQTLSCCVLLRADNAETTSELLKKYSLNLIGNNDTFGVIGK